MDNNIQLTFLDDNGLNYYLFNIDGLLIFRDILNQNIKSNFDTINYTELVKIHKEDFDGYLSDNILLKHLDKFQKIDLIDLIDKIHLDRDWDYEYVESIKPTSKPFEIGFITHNPTYGVQGIKIFKFDISFNFNLMYEMEDLHFDGAFHNLAFNPNGDKFTLLLYNYKDSKDYITICEYLVKNNERSLNERPLNIFKTDFGYWEFGQLNSEYLKDNILCIIRNSDLILFDLSKGKTKEILKRDLNSSYSITSSKLKYQFNEESYEINMNN